MQKQLKISLIITTYNRPDALELVLRSVLEQTQKPHEVIVADDGSGGDTFAVIQKLKPLFEHKKLNFIHAWQEDLGFRLAQARNLALAKATGEYIVIVDGDMLLDKNFIRDHNYIAQENTFIQGRRVMLTEEKTLQLLNNPEQLPQLKFYQQGVETRLEKRLYAINMPFVSKIIARKTHQKLAGIRGCNMAFFKADALKVNGFNNDFVGWGREDSEFVLRLFNAGIKRAELKFGAIAFHLYHHEAKRDNLDKNDKILQQIQQDKTITCANGLTQIKLDNK